MINNSDQFAARGDAWVNRIPDDPEPRLHSDLKPRGVPPASRGDHAKRIAKRPLTLKEYQFNNRARMLALVADLDDDRPRSFPTAPDCALALTLAAAVRTFVPPVSDIFAAAALRADAYTVAWRRADAAWASEFGFAPLPSKADAAQLRNA